MTELELKAAFAEEWLRNPKNPYLAALKVTKNNSFLAVQISDSWIYDDEVAECKRQLIKDRGEDAFLPSTAEMAHDILDRAFNCPDNDQYGKLMRLVADMRGMIQKPGVTITNTVTTNKVMVVPVLSNADGSLLDSHAWEQRLIEQQQQLVSK